MLSTTHLSTTNRNPAVRIPDDATMLEVAQLAADAGQINWCGRSNIPLGWHLVGIGGQRTPAQVAA